MSQIVPIICDKEMNTFTPRGTPKRVRQRIYGHGRGWVFVPKDFLDIAATASIRKALSRLKEQKTIRLVLRGVYDYPSFSELLNAPSSPDPDAIAQAIARSNGWTILPTGDTALNLLDLSRQVPAQYQYFSDGPAKEYQWGGGKLSFKHRTNKETSKLSPRTALLVQALKALGENNVDKIIVNKLFEEYSGKELNLAAKEAKYSTSWVYTVIKHLLNEKKTRHA
jgi:hypothetical protein